MIVHAKKSIRTQVGRVHEHVKHGYVDLGGEIILNYNME